MINIYTNEIRSWNNTSRVVWPRLLTASNNLQVSSLSEKSNTGSAGGGDYLAKEITIYRAGTVKVTFDWNGVGLYSGYILKALGVEVASQFSGSGSYAANTWYSEEYDVPTKMLGTIQLYNHCFGTGSVAKVRNLRIYSDTIRIKNNLDI